MQTSLHALIKNGVAVASMTKTKTRRSLVVALCVYAFGMWVLASEPACAQTPAVPAYRTVSEDLSEQRRAVFVRIDHRMDETDLLAIAAHVQARGKRIYARTQVNFALPGMSSSQGSWASVLFAPEPRILIHGLSRADEDLFLAEFKADRRSLLGAWLTSTPAPLGRLTIYSDHGRLYAEWRLRSGQKTIDELIDTTTKMVRRFDIPDGGYFILTRSGELEIWDKTNLIATAERIRPEHLTSPARVATRPSRPIGVATATQHQMPSSPAQPEPKRAAPIGAASSAGALVLAAPAAAPGAGDPTANRQAVLVPGQAISAEGAANATPTVGPQAKLRKASQVKLKPRTNKVAATPKSKVMTTGDEISAKLAGRF